MPIISLSDAIVSFVAVGDECKGEKKTMYQIGFHQKIKRVWAGKEGSRVKFVFH